MKKSPIRKTAFFVIGLITGIALTILTLFGLSFLTENSEFIPDKTVKNIELQDAKNMISDYHRMLWFKKLKVKTSDQGNKNIQTFIIQDSIFNNLRDLAESQHEEFKGIALNLGINNQGGTLIVNALLRGDSDTSYKHLIPNDRVPQSQHKLYFYDHIDVCPNLCVENQSVLFN